MIFENSLSFARSLDTVDALKAFRERFYIPLLHGKESIYLTGNSLGLQAKSVQDRVTDELEDWANYGVEGHIHARNPWVSYHELFPPLLKNIVGAKESEIVAMNQLTSNLHLLMVSFYRPTTQRYKIICEAKAFPSDQYAFDSQVAFHGFAPREAVVEVGPRAGAAMIYEEDIEAAIEQHKDSLALVLFGGVNYYNGQKFDMQRVAKAAKAAGAVCGFDLAHAVGNVELKLHDWDVDFACWCSYKYLNSGPGAVGGVFIHEKHHQSDLPRFAGWWGHDKASRFRMGDSFHPIPSAEGWQLSNSPVLSMAAHRAALEVFDQAGFDKLLAKAKSLSTYLHFLLNELNASHETPVLTIITPADPEKRGCQVSIAVHENAKAIFEKLIKNGVIADWREPDVIRVAPVPLYNSHEDVFAFVNILKELIDGE